MIVMKFGGTSLASAAEIRLVVDLVRGRLAQKPVVVVSAHAKVTDALLSEARKAVSGAHDVTALIERHQQIARELGVEPQGHPELFKDLTDVLRGISLVGEATPRVLDHVASFGERLSCRTVAAALSRAGTPAEAVDAYDAGLDTDSRYGKAQPLPESFERMRAFFAGKTRVQVVTGFIAKDRQGNVTTVGRNGSDYSAALFARGLDANEIQIWTDVPGVLTADPRMVPEAYSLEVMGFDEAAELAYYGAAVLHPATLVPAVEGNIPVRVLDTRKPWEKGTLILNRATRAGSSVTAIVHNRKVALLNIVTPRMLGHHGFMARIFQACARHEVALDMIATTEVSVSATTEHHDLQPLVDEMREFSEVTVDRNVAAIAVVGHAIGESIAAVEIIFDTLKKEGIAARMISMGARRTNVGLVIDAPNTERCVAALHRAFFAQQVAKTASQ